MKDSAAGNRASFDRFITRHQAALYRFARAITSADSEAEEVLQQAFIEAWRGAGTFRGQGSAISWLFTIARNANRRIHRRRAGEPVAHEDYEDLATLGCEAGWAADVVSLSKRIEEREWIDLGLKRLSDDDCQLLIMVDVEGCAISEAAESLELTVAATKSRLHRARLRLMAALRKEGGYEA